MVDIEKTINRAERALSATILTRNDVSAVVRSESPYIEDRKLIVQQFQNIDRSLDALQVEMKALRADIVEMKLVINRRYRSTGP